MAQQLAHQQGVAAVMTVFGSVSGCSASSSSVHVAGTTKPALLSPMGHHHHRLLCNHDTTTLIHIFIPTFK